MVVDLRDLMGQALAHEDYDRRMLVRKAKRSRVRHPAMINAAERAAHEARIQLYAERYTRAAHAIERQGFDPKKTPCAVLMALGLDRPLELPRVRTRA